MNRVLREDEESGTAAPGRGEGRIVDLYTWRHRYSHVDLLLEDNTVLPLVPVIGTFKKLANSRNVCDHVSFALALRMPNLMHASWRLSSWEIKYLNLRRVHRQMLAGAVAKHLAELKNLQDLRLFMSMPIPWARNFARGDLNPDLTATTSDQDMLSSALGKALAGLPALRSLDIGGTFDSSLLWPPRPRCINRQADADNDGSPSRCWGSLERIRVNLDGRRPSGGAYFSLRDDNGFRSWIPLSTEDESPPGYGIPVPQTQDDMYAASRQSETDHFSIGQHVHRRPGGAVLPDHEGSLSAVFGAFAKACGRLMPKLQMAELSMMVPAIVPLEASVAGPGDGAGGPSFVHGDQPWGV